MLLGEWEIIWKNFVRSTISVYSVNIFLLNSDKFFIARAYLFIYSFQCSKIPI